MMRRFLLDLGVYGFGALATGLGVILVSLWASPAALPRLTVPEPSNVTLVAPNAMHAFPVERLAPFAPQPVPKAVPNPAPAPVALALAAPESEPPPPVPAAHRERRDLCARYGGYRVDTGRHWHCAYAHRHRGRHHG